MASIARMRVTWSGSPVIGPGLSTFYFASSATTQSASVKAFFTAIKANFSNTISWDIPNTGDLLDETTGTLTGVWTSSGGGTVTASATPGPTAGGAGYRVRWVTSGIVFGRRVIGTTFLVPLAGAAYDNDGTPNATVLSNTSTAAAALIAAEPTMRIWSRPNTPGGSNGTSSPVISAFCPDLASSLRSRRV